jgi:hypothetical protein
LAQVGTGRIQRVGGWIWWKYYILMYENGKMRPAETIVGRECGDKGEWWRGWIQLWYIVRIFINGTIYSQ